MSDAARGTLLLAAVGWYLRAQGAQLEPMMPRLEFLDTGVPGLGVSHASPFAWRSRDQAGPGARGEADFCSQGGDIIYAT